MATKFIVFSLLVASVYGSGGYSSFSYGVSDPNTGDIKDQHEKRVGDSVVGKYSLLESDGTKRIVEYEANAATGFNAIVRKEPAGGAHLAGPLAGAPLGHGHLAHPAPVSAAVAHPASIAPIASAAHAVPAAGLLAHPNYPSHAGALSHPGALAHSGILSHPGIRSHAGALHHPAALSHLGAVAHPGALGSLGHAGGLIQPGGINPHANHLAGPHTGAIGLNNPNSPQGVPAVSHFSHSVVHEIPRTYPGPHAGGYNGGYGSIYGGVLSGYGAHGNHGGFAGHLTHPLTAPLGHGNAGAHNIIGAGAHGLPGTRGLAHSYNSLTRGEAYPHGYGGFGARSYGASHGAGVGAGYGAGYGAGFGAGLPW